MMHPADDEQQRNDTPGGTPVIGDVPAMSGIPEGEHNDLGEPDPPGAYGRIGYGRFGRYTPFGVAIVLIIILIVIGILQTRDRGASSNPTTTPPPTPQVGQVAPDFTLATFDGQRTSLSSLRGSVVFVNFWASWCDYCEAEIPDLRALNGSIAGDAAVPVRVMGVGVLADQDAPARAMASRLDIDYLVGRDTGETGTRDGPIQTALGLADWYMPVTVVVAPDGRIAAIHYGPMSGDTMRQLADSTAGA